MIAIVDYQMGNLRSVQKAFERVGFSATLTQDADVIKNADGLVIPGVGAFRKAMENLTGLGLVDSIAAFIEKGKPFLGICLGLQILFSASEEFGLQSGLGIFRGRVVKFPFSDSRNRSDISLKVPHMGWNSINLHQGSPVLKGIMDGTYFYFVHSYYPIPEDKTIVATTTEYGGEFVSSITQGKLFACQFHPEKSQKAGLKILENFCQLVYP